MLLKNTCCHTYSIVLLLHYLTLMWSSSHESFVNSIHILVKHKDYIHYFLLSPIPSHHYDLFQLSSQIHILQSTILLPYLSYYKYPKKSKRLNQPFSIVVLFDCVVLYVYVVLFMCYSLYGELCAKLREVKDLGLQKGKWHAYLLPILLLH
jgi:hypothetical protein